MTPAAALLLLAAGLGAGLAAAPAAAWEHRETLAAFPPGASGVSQRGRIVGDQSVSHLVAVAAGRRLHVELQASNAATFFNVYPPGKGPGDEALANSGLTGPLTPWINAFDGAAPVTGLYRITVYMMRSAARRGEASDYALRLDVSGQARGGGDFADGLAGGPDAYAVRLRDPGSFLSLRERPSTGAARLARLPAGARVRALDAVVAEGRVWRRVAAEDGGTEGWVAAEHLVEAP